MQTFFLAVQKTLAEGGVAYAPISWWSPKWEGGVTKRQLFDRQIAEHLVAVEPDHFVITDFPGAATLIIKGNSLEVRQKTAEPDLQFRGSLEDLLTRYQSRLEEKAKYETLVSDTKQRIEVLERIQKESPGGPSYLELVLAKSDLQEHVWQLERAIRSLADLDKKRAFFDGKI